jgi:hypothetical protein
LKTKFQKEIFHFLKVFSSIKQSKIEKRSTLVLDKLFDSTTLFVGDESNFFKKIQQLIEKDSQNKVNLSKIKFSFISSSEMVKFFESFSLENINLSLLEALKECLFCDRFHPLFENSKTP